MKLEIRGSDHEYKYVVEQSLLALFPQERPAYEPVDPASDSRWAIITLREEGDRCHVTTELGWDGKSAPFTLAVDLSGDDYAREGQRRRAIGMSFFRAAREVTGITPPWGSLSGIRPAKVAAELLEEGGRVVQETRRWDDNKDATFSMRSKEDAQDYRYFPEPDLPPLELSEAYIQALRASQPELAGDTPLVDRVVLHHVGVLTVGENRQVLPVGQDQAVPH